MEVQSLVGTICEEEENAQKPQYRSALVWVSSQRGTELDPNDEQGYRAHPNADKDDKKGRGVI